VQVPCSYRCVKSLEKRVGIHAYQQMNFNLISFRRAPLNAMFSSEVFPSSNLSYGGDRAHVQRHHGISGRIITLSNAFNAFAGDVITEYCFGFCYEHLESLGVKDNFHPAFMAVGPFGHLALQFQMMYPLSLWIISVTV
jgi:hypothetical protein